MKYNEKLTLLKERVITIFLSNRWEKIKKSRRLGYGAV
jgi:hypothetical protein